MGIFLLEPVQNLFRTIFAADISAILCCVFLAYLTGMRRQMRLE